MATELQTKDAADWLGAFLREADRDAQAVGCLFEALGWGTDSTAHASLTENDLYKAAALVRLRRWERTGVRADLPAGNLPASEEVLEDLLAPQRGRPRFSGTELAKAVLAVQLKHLAWPHWDGVGADVALTPSLDPDALLDALARFLWQARHLGTIAADAAVVEDPLQQTN